MTRARDLASGLGGVRPFATASGTGTTDGSGLLTITFPASRFTVAPVLTLSIASLSGAIPASTLAHASVTASGATVFSSNSTNAATRTSVPVNWIAIQMTSGAASG